jgi:choline dehydrogenase-like flavoprotein
MATAQAVLSDAQRETLEALCDTFVPSVQSDTHDELEKAFMARSAGDLQISAQIEGLMADVMVPDEIAGFGGLLDALAAEGFNDADLDGRTQLVHGFRAQDPDAKLGLQAFKGLTLLFFYGLPDAAGSNPNWEAIGFSGPQSAPPSAEEAPKTITVKEISGESATLTCDVCVVGSGAGGGVVAAECAKAGKDVLVLEMGAYRNESDFTNLEIPGYFELYYGGGLATSESGSIAILAGSTLGGGTIVNYMNCVRTPDRILAEWETHGLTGLSDGSFVSDHMEVVLERINANTEATTQNATHRKMMEACDELGYEHRPIWRNASVDDPSERCGHCLLGCQTGCKRSAMKTWLQDASDAQASVVPGCHADRITTADGKATGVEATVTHADGTTTALTIEAPTVVAACGSIENPALLLRSGIGGPAAGKYLRLHPAFVVLGVYDEPIDGWNGQIQSALSDHFDDVEDGFGFLIEATSMFPAFVSPAFPWDSGEQHKKLMTMFRWIAPFITVARDHGSGEVVLDDLGRPVVKWDFDDDLDRRLAVKANVELARLQQAAGAQEIFTAHSSDTRWRQGEDFDTYLAELEKASYEPLDVACFTAHQMGSCRMGSDPETSVADGRGELHDTKGVWIGDASAFPTAPGVNPMVSIMSLAHRTAAAINEGATQS